MAISSEPTSQTHRNARHELQELAGLVLDGESRQYAYQTRWGVSIGQPADFAALLLEPVVVRQKKVYLDVYSPSKHAADTDKALGALGGCGGGQSCQADERSLANVAGGKDLSKTGHCSTEPDVLALLSISTPKQQGKAGLACRSRASPSFRAMPR